jgi:RHS repeat-associated protein
MSEQSTSSYPDQWQSAPRDRVGPIDIPTGRLLFDERDFAVAAYFRLEMRRYFSSARTSRASSLGPGFSHPFDQWLWVDDRGCFVRANDGRDLYVARTALAIGERAHHPIHALTVRRLSAHAFIVRDSDGVRIFEVAQSPVGVMPAGARDTARLARVFRPSGATASLSYDEQGRLAQIAPEGATPLQLEHDAATGRLRAVWGRARADAPAALARYAYDDQGRLVEAFDAAGRSSRFFWEGARLARRVDRLGVGSVFTYRDETERCIRAEGDGGRVEVHFDPGKRNAVAIDVDGLARTMQVSPDGRSIGGTDAHGGRWARELDDTTGVVVARIDRDGERHELAYDARDHLSMSLHADGGSESCEHDEDGQLVMFEDLDGAVWRWGYDEGGLLHARSWPAGQSVVYERDGSGRLSGLNTAAGLRLTFARDAHGRIGKVSSSLGERTIRYDTLGRPVEIVDELGTPTRVDYDECGDLAQIEVADVSSMRYWRQASGAIIRAHGAYADDEVHRDVLSAVVAVNRPDGAIHLTRDLSGRIAAIYRDPSAKYEMLYDGRGALREVRAFGLSTTYYRTDVEERIGAAICRGARVEVERDGSGRPTEVRGDRVESFHYSRGGSLTRAVADASEVRFERDAMGRIVTERTNDAEIRHVYDALGRVITVRSSLGPALLIERNERGDAVRARLEGKTGGEIIFARDAGGAEIERSLPGGVRVRFDRDALGRCTQRGLVRAGAPASRVAFSYRGRHLVAVDDSSSFSRTLSHDASGRLIAVRLRSGATLERTIHDRVTADGRVVDSHGTLYAYDAHGGRVSKSSPDGTITKYHYDRFRLSRVERSDGLSVAYQHDALGRMVERTATQRGERRVRRFVWSGLHLLHELGDGALTTWLRVDGDLVWKLAGDQSFAVLLHPYGAPSELIAEDGRIAWQGDLDLAGMCERSVDQTAQPWRWSGHWEDPDTGLAHTWTRVYDPEVASYLTPSADGVARGLDMYGYLPDPFSDTSPLGLGPERDPWFGHELPVGLEGELTARAIAALGGSQSRPAHETDPWAAAFGAWAHLMPETAPALNER